MLGWLLAQDIQQVDPFAVANRVLMRPEPLDHITRDLVPAIFKDMTAGQRLSLLLPIAYLLGSIPFGMVVGRMKGIDVTRHGSGNIGATNVGRLLGRKYFYLVFTLDLLKGLLPMLAGFALLTDVKRDDYGYLNAGVYLLWLVIGFACIAGHMFSVFMKFKGGKGIATSLGVMVGLYPYFTLPAVPVLILWLMIFAYSRYISLSSIIAAVSFPVWYLLIGNFLDWPVMDKQLALTVFSVVVAILIVVKHRGNIRRLMDGREPHYHPAKSKAETSEVTQ